MPTLFLDGVDGTGKTTMIRRLAETISAPDVRVTEPLWHYLPAVAVPADFGRWVTTTPAAEVAAELLNAATQRTIHQLHRATIERGNVVLVDRGPRTLIASARAHLTTGANADTSADPDHAARQFRTAVARLSSVEDCISIELWVGNYEDIAHRLSPAERTDTQYRRYLTTFLDHFRTGERLPGVRHVTLDATEELAVNVAAVHAAL